MEKQEKLEREFAMAESLDEMRALADQNKHRKSWYEKVCEFLAGIENRLNEICEDDFNSAINYFLEFLLPQVQTA